MATYERLAWDSDFFGFPVARIVEPVLDARELAAALEEMRDERVRLVYWPTAEHRTNAHDVARAAGGFLADRKVTYAAPLPLAAQPRELFGVRIVSYDAHAMCPALDELALTSGEYSRFRVDPNFPPERFGALYRTWMRRSVAGEIADGVLVARDEADDIVGVVTLGEKNGRGDIGLVAVAPRAHGRGIGSALVASAGAWFAERGYAASQVVTQGANVPACRLYEKCGYQRERMDVYFHFWL